MGQGGTSRVRRKALVRARRSRGKRIAAPMAVAADWQEWIASNVLAGVGTAELLGPLADAGVPASLARATIASIMQSPAFAVARREHRRAERLTMVARLGDALEPEGAAIGRTTAPDAATFFERHWSHARPIIFTDIVSRWRTRWTPAHLREHYGDAMIEACTGRDGDRRPDANWKRYRRSISLRDYIDQMQAQGSGNDLYLIANNRNTARPELRGLWNDVVLPDGWFNTPRLPFGSALWLGPAGTITPLHHDTSNILFCQIHGRKRIVLAPPWSRPLLDTADGVYNTRTADDLAREGIDAIEVVVEAGEALLIPLGWWHDVLALDVSVSLAINAFARDNTFEWYRPGSLR